MRDFLLRTSPLDRLGGELCDSVLDTAGSAERLAAMQAAGLFIVALTPRAGRYRVHHLLREVLARLLAREQPRAQAALHERASAWFAAHDLPADAIRHALAAGSARAPELVGNHWTASFNRGELTTVSAWLDQLPEETVDGDVRLWLAAVERRGPVVADELRRARGPAASACRIASAGRSCAAKPCAGALVAPRLGPGGCSRASSRASTSRPQVVDAGTSRPRGSATMNSPAGGWPQACRPCGIEDAVAELRAVQRGCRGGSRARGLQAVEHLLGQVLDDVRAGGAEYREPVRRWSPARAATGRRAAGLLPSPPCAPGAAGEARPRPARARGRQGVGVSGRGVAEPEVTRADLEQVPAGAQARQRQRRVGPRQWGDVKLGRSAVEPRNPSAVVVPGSAMTVKADRARGPRPPWPLLAARLSISSGSTTPVTVPRARRRPVRRLPCGAPSGQGRRRMAPVPEAHR